MIDPDIFKGFWGKGEILKREDVVATAEKLGVETEALIAVGKVEAGLTIGRRGGFYAKRNGRAQPKILFEPHWFSFFTNGVYDRSHPELSYKKWGERPYIRSERQFAQRLLPAMALDPEATVEPALKATSWGAFQIMGFNALGIGYDSIEHFVLSMLDSEVGHLEAFEKFLVAKNLVEPLRNHDWHAFARIYNGAGYAKHGYHTRIAREYAKLTGKGPIETKRRPSAGPQVLEIQKRLAFLGYLTDLVDGIFGRNTESAVKGFQSDHGLVSDGVVGRRTWDALVKAAEEKRREEHSTPRSPHTDEAAPLPAVLKIRRLGSILRGRGVV